MKIFSIDPGSQRIGWCALDGERIERSGIIKIPKIPIEEQAEFIRESFRENPWIPFAERIIIEGQFTGGRAGSHVCTLFTGMIIGALSSLVKTPIEFVAITSWKKTVIGMSHADKIRTRDGIMKILGNEPFRTKIKTGKNKGSVKISYPLQDELDAIGIGWGWMRTEGKA